MIRICNDIDFTINMWPHPTTPEGSDPIVVEFKVYDISVRAVDDTPLYSIDAMEFSPDIERHPRLSRARLNGMAVQIWHLANPKTQ